MNINELYKRIISLQDLSPSEEVNYLFSLLVDKSKKFEIDGILTRYEIGKLQSIASQAEYLMEKYWAEQIILAKDTQAKLSEFIYYKNYQDLTKLEIHSLRSCTDGHNHNFLFVGGGPLPMTAIILAKEYGLKCHIIDVDETAIALSTLLIKKLNLEDRISVELADALTYKDYEKFNVVYVAALVGLTSKFKQKVFKHIKLSAQKDSHIIARSSWGNRRILYKPLSEKLINIFTPLIKVDPYTDVINSVYILKV